MTQGKNNRILHWGAFLCLALLSYGNNKSTAFNTFTTTTFFHLHPPPINHCVPSTRKKSIWNQYHHSCEVRVNPLLLRMNADLDRTDAFPEGDDLAKELYEIIKIREFREKLENDNFQERMKIEEAEKRAINNAPFSYRKEVRLGKDVPKLSSSSFTNTNNANTNDAGFFSGGPENSLFRTKNNLGRSNINSNNSVRDNMMQQEFNLLEQSSSENGILLQAGFVLVLLTFYLYVGMTGGITDGGAGGEILFEETAASDVNSFFESINLGGPSPSLEDAITTGSQGTLEDVWL